MNLKQAYEIASMNSNLTTEQQRKEAAAIIRAHVKEYLETLATL